MSKILFDTLLKDISNLYDGTDDYNVKIEVGQEPEKEIFKAHSVILRARSSYFRSAFSLNWAKKEGDYLILKKPNMTPLVFQIILKYIYTGTVALDASNIENNLIELLVAADEIILQELVEYLQQHIITLNHDWVVQNGVKLFNMISRQKGIFPRLEKYCKDNIGEEPKLFINPNEFWGLEEDTLLSIIQLDNLNMEETEIWENLIKWGIAKNPTLNNDMTTWTSDEYDVLTKTLKKFIQHVRFFQMTPQAYYYKVRPFSKLLPKELVEDLNLYYVVPECKPVTNVLPPRNSFNSSIFTSRHFCLISHWIDGQEPSLMDLKSSDYNFKLLLRGSNDGFKPEDFSSRCDNKGATIVIIKLRNSEKIIGGYNPIKWSKTNKFLVTNQSFIFSVDKSLKSILLSRVKDSSNAISDDESMNIGFGFGDLYIFKKSCTLEHYTVRILDSDTFEIDDYEVFQVLKKKNRLK